MTDSLALQAKNHHVDLYRNVADMFDADGMPRAEAVIYTHEGMIEHSEDHADDQLLARCTACAEVWEPPVTKTGALRRRDWWLCPNTCNLSEKLAGYLLSQMAEGEMPVDIELAHKCKAYLLGLRNPKRGKSWEHVDADPLTWLANEIERRDRWHGRHKEWTPELEQAFEEFDPE